MHLLSLGLIKGKVLVFDIIPISWGGNCQVNIAVYTLEYACESLLFVSIHGFKTQLKLSCLLF